MTKKRNVQYTVGLPDDLQRWVKQKAEEQGVSIAEVIRICIKYVMEE